MSDGPRTRTSLSRDLARLGVAPGDTLLVHSSLSSLGWVCGGALTVVHALMDAVGEHGTLVVPTHTPDNSDPADWSNPPVPESWWPVIRAESPAYDPRVTPALGMGVIPETVRTWPGAVRSAHPQTSFAAVGPRAAALVAEHAPDSMLGEGSPLARLEEAGGRVLLLGTGFEKCTAFHLAEYRVPRPPRTEYACAVRASDGGRAWASFTDVALDERDFGRLGEAFAATGAVTTGRVGQATAHLFSLAEAVAFAVTWFGENRS
ncbi:aminoglycoside N(3)-acetyltransferase [Streptomyces sp. URMC 126]|uniref:aminoglycoside N(3)-acetyltransferase n=1 Tax=Streptomyces sp. URMC 126 TaxID=3423401 RepID=UPI003F1A4A04